MLFATNRMPQGSQRTRRNRPFKIDLQNTAAAQNMYFCERQGENDYVEIGSEAFFQRLRDLPDGRQILFYIHGFDNTPEGEIFPRAERLQQLLDQQPASSEAERVHVVPLIWPCDDDHVAALLDDYWDDQRAADASGMAFGRMLGKFDSWRHEEARRARARAKEQDRPIEAFQCTRWINVLAHSMGNRVLRNAFESWAERDVRGHMPRLFRNLFMVASDVVNHTLEDDASGRYIPDAARNVVVYYASDDLAMPASKLANLRNRTVSQRLGMTGVKDLEAVPKNVYEVDCDDFNNTCDEPKGHTYFLGCPGDRASPVVEHMFSAIQTGRISPDVRQHRLPEP